MRGKKFSKVPVPETGWYEYNRNDSSHHNLERVVAATSARVTVDAYAGVPERDFVRQINGVYFIRDDSRRYYTVPTLLWLTRYAPMLRKLSDAEAVAYALERQ